MTGHARPSPTRAFVKRYPSQAAATTAWQRSTAAQAAGVQTPAAQGRIGAHSLAFDQIIPANPPSLAQMIAVLAPLHRMPAHGLARFDPFLRIQPRLPDAPAPVRAQCLALQAQDKARDWPATTVIHGDFHPGQTLRDGAGTIWLIDLDDMALAPAEADFGNLAAWMATQTPCDLTTALTTALGNILASARIGRADVIPDLALHFGRIAVLRRALKLARRGQTWALSQICAQAL